MQYTQGDMNPWFYQSVMTVRLQKGTLRKDLNVRPIHQDPSQGNHQTTICGNKTGPLSEDNSGTEPRVQHLQNAFLTIFTVLTKNI